MTFIVTAESWKRFHFIFETRLLKILITTLMKTGFDETDKAEKLLFFFHKRKRGSFSIKEAFRNFSAIDNVVKCKDVKNVRPLKSKVVFPSH